jgi:hypothetical protein
MSEITNANQLRGAEFKKLIRRPLTWILSLLGAAVLAALLGVLLGPFFGGIGFVVGLLIAMIVTFAVADHRAENAFFKAFAESHGLKWQGSGSLEGFTPLLRKGDERRANEIFTGPLAEGFEGTLALYTYTVVSRDSDGDRTETDYPFTLILTDLPETVAHMPDLRVQSKSGFKMFEGLEDKFRASHDRVTLESEAMRDRYEIFVGKEQDPVWVRRLFSPTFIVWLTDAPPKKFAFELVAGKLCAYVPKHRDSVEGFEEIMEVGCAVARRLREEATS